ncbi:MAG TPA: transglycosylase SLT domain-containing protein [Alphaproteobacteria bacterium]|nr:transglycosylase SLT domain-containing protein [Alphaproteobacteria bacterium]
MSPVPPVRPDPAARAPGDIRSAIHQASAATGVPFNYLVAQAEQESGFKADARASTSSAAGLYQFTEATWLRMIREHGDKHGVGDLARALSSDAGARTDAATRARILALRDDPKLSAAMAAEYARGNHAQLAQALGREIGATDLYLAHFLGAGGATRFLAALRAEPGRAAADILPEAAAANRSVFFTTDGRARSVDEIYDRFAAKFDPGRLETAASPASPAPPDAKQAAFEFMLAGNSAGSRALEAVLRRTSLAALSGNVLSPTVIAALAALDTPGSDEGTRQAARARR